MTDAVTFLSEFAEAPIFIDRISLKDVGLSADDLTVSIERGPIPLGDGLSEVTDLVKLGWTVRHGVIFITTPETLQRRLEIVVYRAKAAANWDGAIKRITGAVAPNSWDTVGGPASLAVASPVHLVVGQTRPAHEQIEKLLGAGAERASGEPATFKQIGLVSMSPMLAARVDAQFVDIPLKDVAQFWRQQAEAEIVLDEKALNDVGLGADTRVSAELKNLPLRSALSLVLGQVDVAWTVRRGAIWITSPEAAERDMLLVRHPIADLAQLGCTPQALQNVATTIVAPDTWDAVGGPGSAHVGGATLDVRQTLEVQLTIAQLLNDLRARGR